MTKQVILLTGFEPFDRWNVNPSWEVARVLDGQVIGGLKVVSRLLPVEWGRSWPALQEAIREINPRWVLMLGQAAKRPHISVESLARNRCDGRRDNEGKSPTSAVIVVGGVETLEATLPIERIVAGVKSLGIAVERSEDAGGYLCNQALYNALAWAGSANDAPSIGFIHVPGLAGEDPTLPGMGLEDMTRAVRAAVAVIAEEGET